MIFKKIVIVLVLVLILEICFQIMPFNVDFADKVYMKFYYDETKIDCEITDENDIRELKKIFRTVSFSHSLFGTPSCGFSTNISLTFQKGDKKIIICPGGDTCGNIRIGESNRYLLFSSKKLKKFDEIFGKYHGFTYHGG